MHWNYICDFGNRPIYPRYLLYLSAIHKYPQPSVSVTSADPNHLHPSVSVTIRGSGTSGSICICVLVDHRTSGPSVSRYIYLCQTLLRETHLFRKHCRILANRALMTMGNTAAPVPMGNTPTLVPMDNTVDGLSALVHISDSHTTQQMEQAAHALSRFCLCTVVCAHHFRGLCIINIYYSH